MRSCGFKSHLPHDRKPWSLCFQGFFSIILIKERAFIIGERLFSVCACLPGPQSRRFFLRGWQANIMRLGGYVSNCCLLISKKKTSRKGSYFKMMKPKREERNYVM